MIFGRHRQYPVLAGTIREKIRMEADMDRHRLSTEVVNFSCALQLSVLQTVCYVDGVSERKLFHQVRVFVELEPAGHKGSLGIGRAAFQYLPPRFEHNQSVDRVLNLIALEIAHSIV